MKSASRTRHKLDLQRLHYPPGLPITGRRKEIVTAIRRHQVLIVSGQTGSGKSTQLPKMCLEAGRGVRGLIGHTQPRRIAAMTIARRISDELQESVGTSVGYKIRFEEKTGNDTVIKIMTDGILLMEIQQDPLLRTYDTLIIDEAHERSLNIDFLLGILRSLLKRRPDLKLIITSATLDTRKFSEAFGHAPILEVSGRLYPVEVRYRPVDPFQEETGELTHIEAAVRAVEEIERESDSGDILIFMPTEQDIRETCALLEGRTGKSAIHEDILPLFARLTWKDQKRIFAPSGDRKIIVATNIAETSITIPGIRYVVDTGLARISRFNSRTRTLSLPVTPISRSSADQRKGRCGRVADGVCIRLYSVDDYAMREQYTVPEILRANLADVILRMLSLKIEAIEFFPFIDPPDPRNIRHGLDTLLELGAIEPSREQPAKTGDRPVRIALTDIGRRMARLPIDARIARIIIEAEKEGCVEEATVIAAALSVQDPREWPLEQQEAAQRAHALFREPSSDFQTFLNIWKRYHEHRQHAGSQNRMRKFCKTHFLSFRRIREWLDVHQQLLTILKESGEKVKQTGEATYEQIHRAILCGYLANIAMRKEKNIYTAARNREVMIFPGSGLFKKGPPWIMAAEIVETTRSFARTAATIDREWIEPLARGLCRYTYADPHWEKKRGEVVAFEQVSLFGLIIIPRRSVSYGRIDPAEASRIFVKNALIEGELDQRINFLEKNRRLIEAIEAMEDKLRRRDLLVEEDVLAAFYADRLPGVFDIRTLQRRIRERGGDDFLLLREEDLLRKEPDPNDLTSYPDHLSLARLSLPLEYHFNPGATNDGVTARIPHGLIGMVTTTTADWLIPGLQKEKITFLLKALPKEFRKRLVPIPATVDIILREMPQQAIPIATALSTFIARRFGIDIPAAAWSLDALPEYLKMRFSITDDKGREIGAGRDLQALQCALPREITSDALQKAKTVWEKSEVTTWDFRDLPQEIILEGAHGVEGLAYPALIITGQKANEEAPVIALRLFHDRHEAQTAHLHGVRALFALHFNKEFKYLRKQHLLKKGGGPETAYFGGDKKVQEAIVERTLRGIFPHAVRTAAAFQQAIEAAANILPAGLKAADEIVPVLKAYAATRQVIRDLKIAHRNNKTGLSFLAEMTNRLDCLVPQNFIVTYDPQRLEQIPRYLKALEVRIEKGLLHIAKDREKATAVRPFEKLAAQLEEGIMTHTSEERKRAIEDFRWMVEEYQIAVFAQNVKTTQPISPKRLEERYREIEKMA